MRTLGKILITTLAAFLFSFLTACDFEGFNPGPKDDQLSFIHNGSDWSGYNGPGDYDSPQIYGLYFQDDYSYTSQSTNRLSQTGSYYIEGSNLGSNKSTLYITTADGFYIYPTDIEWNSYSIYFFIPSTYETYITDHSGPATITVVTESGKTATYSITIKPLTPEITDLYDNNYSEYTDTLYETGSYSIEGSDFGYIESTLYITTSDGIRIEPDIYNWESDYISFSIPSSYESFFTEHTGPATITVVIASGKTATHSITLKTPTPDIKSLYDINYSELTTTLCESGYYSISGRYFGDTESTLYITASDGYRIEPEIYYWNSRSISFNIPSSYDSFFKDHTGPATITVIADSGKVATYSITIKTPIPEIKDLYDYNNSEHTTILTQTGSFEISGKYFGNTESTLYITTSDGLRIDPDISSWSRSYIYFSIPSSYESYFADHTGPATITVTTGSDQTVTYSITIKKPIPEITSLYDSNYSEYTTIMSQIGSYSLQGLEFGNAESTLYITTSDGYRIDPDISSWNSRNIYFNIPSSYESYFTNHSGPATITVITGSGQTATYSITIKTPVPEITYLYDSSYSQNTTVVTHTGYFGIGGRDLGVSGSGASFYITTSDGSRIDPTINTWSSRNIYFTIPSSYESYFTDHTGSATITVTTTSGKTATYGITIKTPVPEITNLYDYNSYKYTTVITHTGSYRINGRDFGNIESTINITTSDGYTITPDVSSWSSTYIYFDIPSTYESYFTAHAGPATITVINDKGKSGTYNITIGSATPSIIGLYYSANGFSYSYTQITTATQGGYYYVSGNNFGETSETLYITFSNGSNIYPTVTTWNSDAIYLYISTDYNSYFQTYSGPATITVINDSGKSATYNFTIGAK